jgi:hypothetical protein
MRHGAQSLSTFAPFVPVYFCNQALQKYNKELSNGARGKESGMKKIHTVAQ